MINASYRKVGGLHFLKLGRFTVSWSVAPSYRPVGVPSEDRLTRAEARRVAQAVRLDRAYWRGVDWGQVMGKWSAAGMSPLQRATVAKPWGI